MFIFMSVCDIPGGFYFSLSFLGVAWLKAATYFCVNGRSDSLRYASLCQSDEISPFLLAARLWQSTDYNLRRWRARIQRREMATLKGKQNAETAGARAPAHSHRSRSVGQVSSELTSLKDPTFPNAVFSHRVPGL